MIIYRYRSNWDTELTHTGKSDFSGEKETILANQSNGNHFLKWVDFNSYTHPNNEKNHLPEVPSDKKTENLVPHIPELAQHIIEKIMNNYDEDGCIFGLFSALSQAKKRINPFMATRIYCLDITSCSLSGEIKIKISPIYLLGPEYPELYQLQHGTALDENAIIGLTQTPAKDALNSEPCQFSLGIDAGIVFKHSSISHNEMLTLSLKTVKNGLMANLNCGSETTSRKFSWDTLGLEMMNPSPRTKENKNRSDRQQVS